MNGPSPYDLLRIISKRIIAESLGEHSGEIREFNHPSAGRITSKRDIVFSCLGRVRSAGRFPGFASLHLSVLVAEVRGTQRLDQPKINSLDVERLGPVYLRHSLPLV